MATEPLGPAKPFSFLVWKKTGSGKSAFISSLVGRNVTDKGDGIRALEESIKVSVWDTPGLYDDSGKSKSYLRNDLSLKELVKLPVAADWYPLGILLGVPTHKLKEFQANHPHRAQSCLDDMFDWWLKNGENPTRSQLAEALLDIDRRDLAVKVLIAQYKQMRSELIDRQDQPTQHKLKTPAAQRDQHVSSGTESADPAKNSSSQNKKAFPEGEKKSGFRKLWGAVKSCTTILVNGFLEGLGSLAASLGIQRRYKKYNDIERWWFELKADEKDLQALEHSEEWKKLQAKTGWRLGACFMASS